MSGFSAYRTIVVPPELRAYVVMSDQRQTQLAAEKWDTTDKSLADFSAFDDFLYAVAEAVFADATAFGDSASIVIDAALADAITYEDGAFATVDASLTDVAAITEETYSVSEAALDDTETVSDGVSIEVGAALADTVLPGDSLYAETVATFAEGTTYTYFAEDYAAGDYGTTDNFIDEAYAAETATAFADANSAVDNSSADLAVYLADGVTYTYFAEDYAAGDYGVTDNFIDERYAAISALAPVDDTYLPTDTPAAEVLLTSADAFTPTDAQAIVMLPLSADTLSVSEAYVSAQTSYPSDQATMTDASGASWTFPNWADAAVPVDSVAIALTVASTDTSSTSEVVSATIQNYALDPTYFSGDYATTPY